MSARRPALSMLAALGALSSCASVESRGDRDPMFPPIRSDLPLGAFSISLAVKDLSASRSFYEELGFQAVGGESAQGWQILRNGTTTIGLFQGMFEGNLLTFNPGWSVDGQHPEQFLDVREIQAKLEGAGATLTTRAEPGGAGPASITLVDPDGNVVLIDQHVPRPARR